MKFLEGGTAEVRRNYQGCLVGWHPQALGREGDLHKTEAWRKGENTEDFRQNGGSPITNSELRRAVKMAENSTVIRV